MEIGSLPHLVRFLTLRRPIALVGVVRVEELAGEHIIVEVDRA